jgi:hypothetical protein
MYLIEYDQADGTKVLLQMHSDHAPEGAHVRHFEGETAVAAEVDLPNAVLPIMSFCKTLIEQARRVSTGAEVRVGVNFTGRGHAYITQNTDNIAVTITLRSGV